MEFKKYRKSMLVFGFFVWICCGFTQHAFAGEYKSLHTFSSPVIKTLNNGNTLVEIEGTWQKDAIVGAPILPIKRSNIFVPSNEKVTSIQIETQNSVTLAGPFMMQYGTTAYPTSYTGPIKIDLPDANIYQGNLDYPSRKYLQLSSQYLHGIQIVPVEIYPIVYYPKGRSLTFYREIKITVTTESAETPAGIRSYKNTPSTNNRIIDYIDNKEDFIKTGPYGIEPDSGDITQTAVPQIQSASDILPKRVDAYTYVVITTSSLQSAFQALISHRQSAVGGGFSTFMKTIEAIKSEYTGVDDAEKMRNFIIDMYTNHNTEYVVLGGDCDGPPGSQTIPTRGCYATVNGGDAPYSDPDYNLPSDLYFGCLDGSWNNDSDSLWAEPNDGVGGGDIDWTSEVYVGRIPADNATEAQRQIQKIISYETGSTPIKTVLIGEKLDTRPTWGGDRMDWVYEGMKSMAKSELYDRDHASNNWPKSDLITAINTNQNDWLNHLGHGNRTWNMKLGNNDVASMTNTVPFFLYTQACYSGSIDGRTWDSNYMTGDCVLEDMVNSSSNGAFAIIGNSRYGWYNPGTYVQGTSNRVHRYFVDEVFSDVNAATDSARIGRANQISKAKLDLTQGVFRWIALETNLLGDPATELRLDSQPHGQVLWDQPISNDDTNTYACQDFETANNAYDMFIADDFICQTPWQIEKIFIPGNTWNPGNHLDSATFLRFQIYNDNSGKPAGYPDGGLGSGGSAPVWSLSVPTDDPRISLENGIGSYKTNISLNLATPISLQPGKYWLVAYPVMDFTIGGQWGRHSSDTVNGTVGQMVNPGTGFGMPATWTSIQDGGWIDKHDMAFRLEGTSDIGDHGLFMELSYVGNTLNIQLEIGMLEASTLNLRLSFMNKLIPLLNNIQLPPLDPSVTLPINIPNFPHLGKIGFMATLTPIGTFEGVKYVDWKTVDTGPIGTGSIEALSKFTDTLQ